VSAQNTDEIIIAIQDTLKDCKVEEDPNPPSTQATKEALLKMTNCSSELKLLERSKGINLAFKNDTIVLERITFDPSQKGLNAIDFLEEIKIPYGLSKEKFIKVILDGFASTRDPKINFDYLTATSEKPPVIRKKKDVLDGLQEIGFFDYAEKKAIKETFEEYKNDGCIKFHHSLNRTFSIDAESIYEANGLESFTSSLVETFSNLGINLEVGEAREEYDGNKDLYTKREITINGKTYSTPNVKDWGSGFYSGFRLVNQLLKENKFDGEVYGLFMDETSLLIILNKTQFNYLQELIPIDHPYRPIDIKVS